MPEPITLYRNSVQTWECDQMGHMNVQFYLEKASVGLALLAHRLGLGPDFVQREHARLTEAEHHVKFLREQHPGAPLELLGGVLDVTPNRIRAYLELVNPASGETAASFIVSAELRDIRDRSARPLPPTALAAAERLRIELPAHGAPRGLEPHPPRPAPERSAADAMGMPTTYQGVVLPPLCDLDGYLSPRGHMAIVSDSIPNLMLNIRGENRGSGGKTGGAALEYRFVYRTPARAGDLVELRSGVIDLGAKTYRLGHWLFNTATGASIATAEAVAVSFDLDTRKAIAIPDEARASMARFVMPELEA